MKIKKNRPPQNELKTCSGDRGSLGLSETPKKFENGQVYFEIRPFEKNLKIIFFSKNFKKCQKISKPKTKKFDFSKKKSFSNFVTLPIILVKKSLSSSIYLHFSNYLALI